MGLDLEVGILADLQEHDPEAVDDYQAYFAAVNILLKASGLPEHSEPDRCRVWSTQMYGYYGLHYLRRVAAHLDLNETLPEPGDENSSDDKILKGYFDSYIQADEGWFRGLLGSKKKAYQGGFDHLIIHGDAEGFYLPQDFDSVLIGDDDQVPGGMVGSSPRLLAELDRLADGLEIPDELDVQSDALWDAVETQGEGEAVWERYAIETFSCVALRKGCRHSISEQAALVFC